MKTKTNLLTLALILFAFTAAAQQGINYKAIINDANGDALVNTPVIIQFTILENETTSVYQETHNPTTNANGIIIVNIGEGSPVSGVFNDIDWGGNPHFLKTEIDKGDGLTDMGTTEFKTVPYAFYAKTAEDAATKEYVDQLVIRIEVLENYVENLEFNTDNDEDGFSENEGDCNDNVATINPDAIEICDGIDNNCNGQIDENCSNDNDGDGFTPAQGDCNDNDVTINPNATEICDGKDNNCDGEVDEGFDTMSDPNNCGACGQSCPNGWACVAGQCVAPDADQDGYPANVDCNDSDPAIYPGASEICGNGIDNNCNGIFDEGCYDNLTHIQIIPSCQCDPSWANIGMGSNLNFTICQAGTVLTSLTMLLSSVDPSITPVVLNSFLTLNGGYQNEDDHPIIYYSAINLYPESDIVYERQTQILSTDELKSEIDNGTPVIASIDNVHFIIIYGYEDFGTELTHFVFKNTYDCNDFSLNFIDQSMNITKFVLFDKSNQQ